MKGDERIPGDGDFVMKILSEADERLDRRFELKSLGYDFDKAVQKFLESIESRGRICTQSAVSHKKMGDIAMPLCKSRNDVPFVNILCFDFFPIPAER